MPYERVRELSITYDKETGQFEARLVVEVMNPMAKARGLQLGRLARRVRPHTGGPADVLRSDGVGRPSEAALDAAKLCLRRPVGLRHMPAGRTGAGGVPGIDDYHRDTR